MDPTSQLIRFSIPGSIFVLASVGTCVFTKLAWGQHVVDIDSLATVTVAAAAVSIPVGFLGYQLYYWGYGPFVPFVRGGMVTRDRGREALSALPVEILGSIRTLFNARLDIRSHHCDVETPIGVRLKLLKLDDRKLRTRYKENISEEPEDDYRFEEDERETARIYSDNWYENWDVFRALLDLAASHGERPEIKRNFTTLYDIYHALGASRLAVVLGSGSAVFYLFLAHQSDIAAQPGDSVAALYWVVVTTGFVAYTLHRTRIATWKSAVSKVRLDLRACFTTNEKLTELLPSVQNEFEPRINMRRNPPERHKQLRMDVGRP
jgi:hypothetical protein